MSITTVNKRLISQAEFRQMGEMGLLKPDEKVELIHGEIYNMAPIGSRHASIVEYIVEILVPKLVGKAILRIQNPIRINEWNEPEPDLAILKYRKDRYKTEHPESDDVISVIEVSDTTYPLDKNVKLPLYASAGIPIFWIINLSNESIEVYSEPKSDQYRNLTLYFPGDEIDLLGNKLDVAQVFGH